MIRLTIIESLTEQSSGKDDEDEDEPIFETDVDSDKFHRHASSFLRVADLQLDENLDFSIFSRASIPNFHRSAVDPPPGVPADPLEKWVALDNGQLQHAPMARAVIDALAATGMRTALHSAMWTPDTKTLKILACKQHRPCWENTTFALGPVPAPAATYDDHVLVWSGKFSHGLYGSDLPAVRAAAVINMSPEKLLNLLVDSSRVKEYNAMSLGRTDLLALDHPACEDTICTKVMRSESRPPLLRKTLQFTSLFHARRLEDDGYLLVSRAVSGSGNPAANMNSSSILVSEILLGVNVIRKISDHQCVFVTVNHVRSPMVPLMIAKRLGLQAAVNFICDLRRCCDTPC